MPWEYIEKHGQHYLDEQIREDFFDDWNTSFAWFFGLVIVGAMLILYRVISLHRKKGSSSSKGYRVLGDADCSVEIEKLPLRQI